MPDSFNSRDNGRAPSGAPQDWSEALASLPLESPSGDGWLRVAQALDRRHFRHHQAHRERHATWVIGLASAAVLVMAAWSPLSHWLQDKPTAETPAAVAVNTAPGSRGPAAPMRGPANATPYMAIDAASKPAMASNVERGRNASVAVQALNTRAHVARRPSRTPVQLTQAEPQETAPAPRDVIATTPPATDPIQVLQAQSARLETLVAIARDDRVGSASSELLGAELDAGIAAVDASLSQEDLDDSRRQDLWQQRVDLLQQLAGVESTARWLAAQGMSNETALVSVD